MRVRQILAAGALLTLSLSAGAQSSADPHAADREVLRALLAKVEKALNDKDTVAFGTYLHPNAVVTYQNAEVSRGVKEAEAFYARMMSGPSPIVQDFSTSAQVSAPADFYALTAVAHGTAVERYVLTEGLEFSLDTHWTATATRQDDQWKIAALHFSSNLFDNPILAGTRRSLWWAGGAGVLFGVLLTVGLTRIRRARAAA